MNDQSTRRVRKRTHSPDFTSEVDVKMESQMELDEDLFCLDHIKSYVPTLRDNESGDALEAEDGEEGDAGENDDEEYQDQEKDDEDEDDKWLEFNRVWPRYPYSMRSQFLRLHSNSRQVAGPDRPAMVYMVVRESQRIPTRDSEPSRETHGVYRRLNYANYAAMKIFQGYLRIMRDQLLDFRWKFSERGTLTLVATDFEDGWKHTVYIQRERVREDS